MEGGAGSLSFTRSQELGSSRGQRGLSGCGKWKSTSMFFWLVSGIVTWSPEIPKWSGLILWAIRKIHFVKPVFRWPPRLGKVNQLHLVIEIPVKHCRCCLVEEKKKIKGPSLRTIYNEVDCQEEETGKSFFRENSRSPSHCVRTYIWLHDFAVFFLPANRSLGLIIYYFFFLNKTSYTPDFAYIDSW